MPILNGFSGSGSICPGLLTVWLGIALAASSASSTEPPTPVIPPAHRSAVPSAEAQAAAQLAVQDVHGKELKKTAPADRRALFATLMSEAKQGTGAEQYVLLIDARDIAISLGAASLALDAIDAIGESFDVKTNALAADAVMKSAAGASTPDAKDAVLEGAERVLQAALGADDYSVINSLSSLVGLRGASDPAARAFRSRLAEARALATEHHKIEAAEQKLREQPDDAAAMFEIGQFLCLYKGDWQRGLPLLAKGANAPLAVAAAAELAAPGTATDLKKVADQWWALAEKQKNPARHHLHVHAAALYERALPGLAGLGKAAAEKRIAETADDPASDLAASGGRVINLLKLIDLKKNIIHGDWHAEGSALQCTSGGFVPRVQIPYRTPDEYDVQMSFSQPAFRNGVFIVLCSHGHQFYWFIKQTPPLCGFAEVAPRSQPAGPPQADGPSGGKPENAALPTFEPKRKYTTLVQVRRNSLKGYLDGKLIVTYATDFSDMHGDDWHDLKDKTILGIGCDDPATFYDLTLTEISGAGKPMQ